MQATIVKTNYGRDMYIFERSDGQHGYFELMGGQDLEVEDTLIGNFSDLGGETVRNVRTGEMVEIFIEDYCSYNHACERVFV